MKKAKVNETQISELPLLGAGIQRNYKDTVFRMIFREKENLLSLYNAMNGTAYEKPDDLEITTLENAVYMNYKNDISLNHSPGFRHPGLLFFTTGPTSNQSSKFCICQMLSKRNRTNRPSNCR